MRDVVADAGKRVDHGFHFVQHAVDDGRKPRERLVDVAMRKTLMQISGDDAPDPLVDLLDAPLRAQTEPGTGQQAEAKGGQQSQRKRLTDNMRNFPCLVHISAYENYVTVLQTPRRGADQRISWFTAT